jgi:hypothetical protein
MPTGRLGAAWLAWKSPPGGVPVDATGDRPGHTNRHTASAHQVHQVRQIRTFIPRAPLHKNTVGLLALGNNQGRASGQLRECVGR